MSQKYLESLIFSNYSLKVSSHVLSAHHADCDGNVEKFTEEETETESLDGEAEVVENETNDKRKASGKLVGKIFIN